MSIVSANLFSPLLPTDFI